MPNMEIINPIVITITKIIMSQVQPKRMVFPIMISNTGTQLDSLPRLQQIKKATALDTRRQAKTSE